MTEWQGWVTQQAADKRPPLRYLADPIWIASSPATAINQIEVSTIKVPHLISPSMCVILVVHPLVFSVALTPWCLHWLANKPLPLLVQFPSVLLHKNNQPTMWHQQQIQKWSHISYRIKQSKLDKSKQLKKCSQIFLNSRCWCLVLNLYKLFDVSYILLFVFHCQYRKTRQQ